MSGELNEELSRIDREATEMVEKLTAELAAKNGVNEGLAQKAMDKADRLRVTNVRESVKAELDKLSGIAEGKKAPEPARDR